MAANKLNIGQLLENTEKYLTDAEINKLKKTIEFAQNAHHGQKRKSGEPYFIHPLWIANYLAEKEFDLTSIQAALLHDVPEDTTVSLAEIKKKFGAEVANIIDGITKLGKVRLKKAWFGLGRVEKEDLPEIARQAETLKKMILAMSKDIRVIIVKLVDRWHNMLTLEFVDEAKRTRIAEETLNIYAQIANRLGMNEIKEKLQDLAFQYLFPEEYQGFYPAYQKAVAKRERYIEKIKKQILKVLAKNKIFPGKVDARIKSAYSTFTKVQKHSKELKEIFDLVALRIIVKTTEECYQALGAIHNHFKPFPNLIKDYISQPKPNGYQSLHTTVFGPENVIFEIQIRTFAMHDQAEYGIAAHWYYAEQKTALRKRFDKMSGKMPEKQLKWLQELAKFQKNISDPQEFADSMKIDFFSDRIFVYTPKGDVKDLPVEATAIDFAFLVHSEIGYHLVGAKINGKIANLATPLENMDVVEILVSPKAAGPKRDWLDLVKTANARYHIKKFLRTVN